MAIVKKWTFGGPGMKENTFTTLVMPNGMRFYRHHDVITAEEYEAASAETKRDIDVLVGREILILTEGEEKEKEQANGESNDQ
jgi:hypothetical protein